MSPITPLLARAAGLPVFVCCQDCRAPSRPLDLQAVARRLGRDADLASAAKAGRFRCAACGSRRAALMPTLSTLIVNSQRLRMRCINCAKDSALTAAAACERFGLATPFDLMRAQVRCRAADACHMNAGVMIAGALTEVENARLRARETPQPRPGKSDKVRDCGFL